MEKSLNYYIDNLPPYIGREIFKFVIPDSQEIIFKEYYNWYFHSSKYEAAFICNKLVKNKNGVYLCRIPKKNNKHRYYVTELKSEVVNREEMRENHRAGPEYDHFYDSKYVGKNIDDALIALFA